MPLVERIYRPDTVSVKDMRLPTNQAELWTLWGWAETPIKFNTTSEYETIKAKLAIRHRKLHLTAHKRRGYFLMTGE